MTPGNHRRPFLLATCVLFLVSLRCAHSFSVLSMRSALHRESTGLWAARYGPPLEDKEQQNKGDEDEEQRSNGEAFRQLLEKVMTAAKPEHIPSLLIKHTQVILNMKGEFAVLTIQEILEEARQEGGEKEVERVSDAIEMILSFAENFVEETENMDKFNKQLLGKIIKTMTAKEGGSDLDREDKLDELLASERENFTQGFLRHLDGQCERIASSPKINSDTARLQEILMIIKSRIVEELGKDLGEAAVVLGQLVAYDDRLERLAVLDTGLTVRGLDFAFQLGDLTAEALQGFKNVPGGADYTLVERVEEIDQRLRSFIEENSDFQ